MSPIQTKYLTFQQEEVKDEVIANALAKCKGKPDIIILRRNQFDHLKASRLAQCKGETATEGHSPMTAHGIPVWVDCDIEQLWNSEPYEVPPPGKPLTDQHIQQLLKAFKAYPPPRLSKGDGTNTHRG